MIIYDRCKKTRICLPAPVPKLFSQKDGHAGNEMCGRKKTKWRKET